MSQQKELRKSNTGINKQTHTHQTFTLLKKIARNCKFKLFNTECKRPRPDITVLSWGFSTSLIIQDRLSSSVLETKLFWTSSRLRNRMSPSINKRGERGECTCVKDIGLVIRGPTSVRTRNIFRFSYDLGCCYTFVSSLKLR